ncbi:MAG: lysophospholipid acyltransferase family protein [Deltaproteobacteria bacterium]|nr:lysophospholipid acyltransferase family protein [Deltaproteobacteria bacterium]
MVVRESIARDVLRLIIWYPVRWFLTIIPLRAAYPSLRALGSLHYAISGRKNARLFENFELGLGQKGFTRAGVQEAVRDYYRNHYVNQLQIFIFPRLNRRNVGKVHEFEGLERLDASLKENKGCILLHSHFGPSQMPLHILGVLGYQVVQLGLPTDEGLSFIGRRVAFRLRLKYESKIKARIIPATSFLRPLFETLKNNGVLLMTGDGAGKGKLIGKLSVERFLGNDVFFTTGSRILAEKTGAVVLPMFTVLENGRYRTVIHEPLNKNGTETVISDFVKIMESYVVRYPHLWHFWDEFDGRIASPEKEAQTPGYAN